MINLFLVNISLSANNKLSKNCKVSLITYSPGSEVYAIFGHSAIRIFDPALNIDYTFSYGTFDFDTPHFYLKFIYGNLDYFLTVSNFRRTIQYYISENQSINEMVFNFTLTEKQNLYNYLLENYKPENRYYKYDFFFDNCATRIRDMFILSSDDTIFFDEESYLNNKSYRELLKPFIKNNPWLDLGINLALGLPADKNAEVWGSMYLPLYLKESFEKSVFHRNDSIIPVLQDERVLFKANSEIQNEKNILNKIVTPIIILSLILIITLFITFYEYLKQRRLIWFDQVLFGITGVLGLVIFLLWVATTHKVMNNNLNVLWALPTHFFIVWILKKEKFKKLISFYFSINILILIVLLLSWKIFPQEFNNELILLIIALLIRSLAIIFIKNPLVNKNVLSQ